MNFLKRIFKRKPKTIEIKIHGLDEIDSKEFRKALSKIDLEKEYQKLSRGTTKINLV